MKQKLITFVTVLGVFFTGFSFVFANEFPKITSVTLYPDKVNQNHTFLVNGENLIDRNQKVNFKFQLTYSDQDEEPEQCDAQKARDVSAVGTATPSAVAFQHMVGLMKSRKWRICFFDMNGFLIFSESHVGYVVDKCKDSLKKEGAVKFLKKSSIIHSNNTISVNTSDCQSHNFSVSFHGYSELAQSTLSTVDLKLLNSSDSVEKVEFVPNEDVVNIHLITNEDSCYGLDNNPDCLIYTKISVDGNEVFSSKDSLISLNKNYDDADNSQKKVIIDSSYNKACIMANCDGSCGTTDWELVAIEGATHHYAGTINEESVPTVGPKYDTESPCYSSELGGYKPGCYEFLAPIDFDTNGGNLNGVQSKEGRTWIENIREFRFGDYVNFLFRIAISALVIISVVMIMVAGIEYMTVESLFGKSQAKARIKGAVGGLILALASYTILHTLNPKLLDMSALDNMEVASLVGGDPDPNDTTTASIGGKQCVMVESPWGAPSEKIANFKIKCSSNYSLTDIAKSFIGHTTYRFGAKGGKFPSNMTQCLIDGDHTGDKCKNDQGEMQRCGEFCPSDSLCLDCSGFVYEVLKCKGLSPKKYGSVNYFGDGKDGKCKKQKIKITSATKSGDSIILNNGSGGNVHVLKKGDLIGAPNHHIAMYIGNGKFIDSQPGRKSKNTAVKVRDFMKTFNDKKHGAWIQYVVPFDKLKDC